MIFIIKGFWTIVFIFIVISTMLRPLCPPTFFRCLSNSGTYMELQTTSFIESTDYISFGSFQLVLWHRADLLWWVFGYWPLISYPGFLEPSGQYSQVVQLPGDISSGSSHQQNSTWPRTVFTPSLAVVVKYTKARQVAH